MSWNGTVRCSVCYENGHNKTSCPTLKKAWEEDPTSWKGREWQRILDRKAKPKICGYCNESGHTRAGCDTMKAHKSLFHDDLVLWRTALVKWASDVGLGVGALVRCKDAQYHGGDQYHYPSNDGYIPPVGLVMQSVFQEGLTHYHGIPGTNDWLHATTIAAFERLGASTTEMAYARTVGVTLPCIPGVVPRVGKAGWYNQEVDRLERMTNVDWEVVSRGQTDFSRDAFVSSKGLKKAAKIHFAAPQEQTERSFSTFGDFQRKQLQQYVNGEIELSEMKDPELPETDS